MSEGKLIAVETTGTVDESQVLHLDGKLPFGGPRRVRVIVLYEIDEDIDEPAWLYAAAHNRAFEFLNEPEEDIYSMEDGKPFHDEA